MNRVQKTGRHHSLNSLDTYWMKQRARLTQHATHQNPIGGSKPSTQVALSYPEVEGLGKRLMDTGGPSGGTATLGKGLGTSVPTDERCRSTLLPMVLFPWTTVPEPCAGRAERPRQPWVSA